MESNIEIQLIARNAQVEEIGEEQKKYWRFDLNDICPFLYDFLLISASRIVYAFLLVWLYNVVLMELNKVSRG